MNTPPRRQGPPAGATVPVKDDPLLGADGRVGPALLRLWTYAALCGASATGVGRLMVSFTDKVLPATPVRLGSITAVVLASGLAADRVLSHLNGLTTRLRLVPSKR